ncbi:MAG: pseudaminic acid synthase [Candidatus Binatia bacterium]
MRQIIEINGRRIGQGYPCYIIAEMSGNHGQSFDQAVKIIKAAKEAGADAVKLQTYTPDTLTIDCDNPHFRINGTLWNGRVLYDLYREAFTPWEWQPQLKEIAEEIGLELFSTPFDATAVDFLERMGVSAHKISSFENCDIALLRRVAALGKPIIASTGMSTLGEIDELVQVIKERGGEQLALLKCTSAYPAPYDEMNLRTIPHLAQAFGVPVGLSDHTLGGVVPVVAATLGACIIEKHFTLSRSLSGPDSAFSLEPQEFKAMVDAVRISEKALGRVEYGLSTSELKSRVFRRSLFVVENIRAGEIFTDQNVRSIRPSYGIHTRHLEDVLGRVAARDIVRGTPLAWEMIGIQSARVAQASARRSVRAAG